MSEAPFEETWFHLPLENVGDAAPLGRDEAFHLLKVLRVRPGRRIVVTNGRGRVFLADTAERGGNLEVTAVELLAERPAPRLHVVMGLLKGRDTEDPVEGLCQLPVAAIHLVTTDHTQAFKGQDHGRLVERLAQKSLAALKQAKKPWLTAIHAPAPIRKWREGNPGPLVLVHPGPDRLDRSIRAGAGFFLLTGPEGGFSEAELAWLAGPPPCMTLGLGETRLRGTHAPLLACGKLMGLGLLE